MTIERATAFYFHAPSGKRRFFKFMEIGILHLTDLHFKANDNIFSERSNNFHSAIKYDLEDIEKIYIVISGDITNRGNPSGYIEAKKNLDKIKEDILRTSPNSDPQFIVVPGNHDCNFDYATQLRDIAIGSMGSRPIDSQDNSVVNACTEVQNDFWDFYNTCCGMTPDNKLFYQITDKVNGVKICFNCINSSWMSKRHEEAKLFFPVHNFVNHPENNQGTINISVFHYPIAWFTPNGEKNNRKEFLKFIEDISTIAIYGHEHEEEHKKLTDLKTGDETFFITGKIFQNHQNPENSGFQFVRINLSDQTGLIRNYIWKTDLFDLNFEKTFQFNGNTYTHNNLKPNSNYLEQINTVNIPISLDGNKDMKLSDFYVFPDLENTEMGNKDLDYYYDSEKLIHEEEFQSCIIEGENQSGKTSLTSMLYLKFIEDKQIPIYINCKSLKADVDKTIKKAFKQQYEDEEFDYNRFSQLEKSKKVIFLDNFQDIQLSSKLTNQALSKIKNRFSKIIITTNSLYGLLSNIESELEELRKFSLRPLGYKKRNQLIENYHKINISLSPNAEKELLERTKHSFNQVESVLGNKLMPSYPVFVLSILQTLVYAKPTNLEQTSYGYCYHSLIHIGLSHKASIKHEYIDTFFNFLSQFAFHLYSSNKTIFSKDELEEYFVSYKKEYHAAFTFDILIEALLKSTIIVAEEHEFKFSYIYIFYYLVARKIAEIINKDQGKKVVKNLCKNLEEEKNANILVFIAHHTKDDFLIDEATFTSMIPFEDIEPITLMRDGHYYKLIQDIVKEIASDIIEERNDPVASRNKMLESRDNLEKEKERKKEEVDKIKQDEEIKKILLPFSQSLRAIEIVGQIIKNRRGSIPRDQLIEMIAELYNTAFRAISCYGNYLSETKEDLIDFLKTKIENKKSNEEIETIVNAYFQYISFHFCLGYFQKVVHAVGQNDLKELYIKASNKINSPAADIVTFSINTFYGQLTTNELKEIVKKYENNPVIMQLLKSRVKSYIYQNYVDFRKKQSFASILKMKIRPINVISRQLDSV